MKAEITRRRVMVASTVKKGVNIKCGERRIAWQKVED